MTPPGNPSSASVRVYARNAPAAAEQPAAAADEPAPTQAHGAADDALDVIDTLLECRRTERDLAQIARDPTQLPGYRDLPDAVQALSGRDPMRFWLLWQLAQSGVDLHELERMRRELQRQLDAALHADGWDGTSPPTDAQLQRAGATLRQRMEES